MKIPVVLTILVAAAAAQSVPSDEMRANTLPYAPPGAITLRTQTDLVEVPVVVRDGNRRTIAGLTREDFEVYDSGKKQAVTSFTVQHFTPDATPPPAAAPAPAKAARRSDAPPPRFIALLFDNLNIDPTTLKPARDAALKF